MRIHSKPTDEWDRTRDYILTCLLARSAKIPKWWKLRIRLRLVVDGKEQD